jgi:hypothetical protein
MVVALCGITIALNTVVTVLYYMYYIECCEHWYDFTVLCEWRLVECWFAYARRKPLCATVAWSYRRTRFIVNTFYNWISPYATNHWSWTPLWSTQITRLVDAKTTLELYCFALCELKSAVLHVLSTRSPQWNWIILPCANWSQLYYTSCRCGVCSGTEATLLASVPT